MTLPGLHSSEIFRKIVVNSGILNSDPSRGLFFGIHFLGFLCKIRNQSGGLLPLSGGLLPFGLLLRCIGDIFLFKKCQIQRFRSILTVFERLRTLPEVTMTYILFMPTKDFFLKNWSLFPKIGPSQDPSEIVNSAGIHRNSRSVKVNSGILEFRPFPTPFPAERSSKVFSFQAW